MRSIFKRCQFCFPERVTLKAHMSLSEAVFTRARFDISHPTQRKINSGTIFIHGNTDFWFSPHWILTLQQHTASPLDQGEGKPHSLTHTKGQQVLLAPYLLGERPAVSQHFVKNMG